MSHDICVQVGSDLMIGRVTESMYDGSNNFCNGLAILISDINNLEYWKDGTEVSTFHKRGSLSLTIRLNQTLNVANRQ